MSTYKIVTCPNCGQREAFVYLGDIEKAHEKNFDTVYVKCNRRNECGFNGLMKIEDIGSDFVTPGSIQKVRKKEDVERRMSERGKMAIHFLSKRKFSTPFSHIRGISVSTLRNSPFSYVEETWGGFLDSGKVDMGDGKFFEFDKKVDFGPFYQSLHYRNRNIIFWVHDYKGNVSRLLMRSTDPKTFVKELQMVIPGDTEKYTLWNAYETMNGHHEGGVIACEGGYEGAVLLEAVEDKSIGVVALAGIGQVKRFSDWMISLNTKHKEDLISNFRQNLENTRSVMDDNFFAISKDTETYAEGIKDLKLYIMLDADIAGAKGALELQELYPNSIIIKPLSDDNKGDFNDMYIKNKGSAVKYVNDEIKKL